MAKNRKATKRSRTSDLADLFQLSRWPKESHPQDLKLPMIGVSLAYWLFHDPIPGNHEDLLQTRYRTGKQS